MSNKTKEDILDGYESVSVQMGYEHEDRVDMWERGCIEQAMDEYARIVAIEFKKWLSEESDKRVDILKLTDDQLYTLFLKQDQTQQK